MRNPTYKVRGTRWEQPELVYGEDFAVRKLLATYSDMPQGDEAIPQFMERMYSDGKILEFGAIILKPHAPTPIHRWINDYLMKKRGIAGSNVVEFMDRAQVASMVRDFFVLRERWMERFLNTRQISELSSQRVKRLLTMLQPS